MKKHLISWGMEGMDLLRCAARSVPQLHSSGEKCRVMVLNGAVPNVGNKVNKVNSRMYVHLVLGTELFHMALI